MNQNIQNVNEENKTGGLPTDAPESSPVDSLADRLGEVEGISEDTAEFLAENWQRFLGMAMLVIIGLWIFNQFNAAVDKKSGEASAKFSKIQAKNISLLETPQEKDAVAIKDTIDVLAKSYSNSPYATLAPLYNARLLISKGEFDQARKQLMAEGAMKFSKTPEIDDEVLRNELASLLYAKSYLIEADRVSAGSDSLIQTSKKSLTEIAEKAHIVNSEALIALIRLAKGSKEKDEVLSLTESVLEDNPAVRPIIEQEYNKLGVRLPS